MKLTEPSDFEAFSDQDLEACTEELFRRYYERTNQDANNYYGMGSMIFRISARGRQNAGLEVEYALCLDNRYIDGENPRGPFGFEPCYTEALRRLTYNHENAEVKLIGLAS